MDGQQVFGDAMALSSTARSAFTFALLVGPRGSVGVRVAHEAVGHVFGGRPTLAVGLVPALRRAISLRPTLEQLEFVADDALTARVVHLLDAHGIERDRRQLMRQIVGIRPLHAEDHPRLRW